MKAKIIATKWQLDSIGMNANDAGKECEIAEKDKYMRGTASKIIIQRDEELLRELGINQEYIIHTKWLKIL